MAQSQLLKQKFIDKGYPEELIHDAYSKFLNGPSPNSPVVKTWTPTTVHYVIHNF